ncbi:hypothetical protein SSP24_09060 [Streptomyces spinoverrucosus]|uniref:Uncharacterized protein n=1 Tax=Streptomyces spinoverrucosus TaxID=284043 RepID=A0A4Y3VCF5_9ACTN|nr:hypothetical protein SSP24_09060 [Streptomyces spinoverrucosus]GHB37108.1 hypothetical protein GCM10010397_03500 [Streptomyces spinoverrucosus]
MAVRTGVRRLVLTAADLAVSVGGGEGVAQGDQTGTKIGRTAAYRGRSNVQLPGAGSGLTEEGSTRIRPGSRLDPAATARVTRPDWRISLNVVLCGER